MIKILTKIRNRLKRDNGNPRSMVDLNIPSKPRVRQQPRKLEQYSFLVRRFVDFMRANDNVDVPLNGIPKSTLHIIGFHVSAYPLGPHNPVGALPKGLTSPSGKRFLSTFAIQLNTLSRAVFSASVGSMYCS